MKMMNMDELTIKLVGIVAGSLPAIVGFYMGYRSTYDKTRRKIEDEEKQP